MIIYTGKTLKTNPELREAFVEAYEKIIVVIDKLEQELAEEAESGKI